MPRAIANPVTRVNNPGFIYTKVLKPFTCPIIDNHQERIN
jgi:hypothetical protein